MFFFFRFQLNAIANRAAGKGYENEDNYSNIKFQFIGIENIHVMRNSLQKLLEGNTVVYRPPQVKKTKSRCDSYYIISVEILTLYESFRKHKKMFFFFYKMLNENIKFNIKFKK